MAKLAGCMRESLAMHGLKRMHHASDVQAKLVRAGGEELTSFQAPSQLFVASSIEWEEPVV